jgi:hypothetical protein
MAKKTTKAQKTKRIRIIYELMLLDTPRSDIIRYGSDNWGVSSRTTENYIKAAYELIAEEAAKIQEDAMIFHLAQIKLLANKAIKDGDKRLFFDVIRDRAKLLDLYPKQGGSSEDKPFVVKVIRVASDDLDWDSDDE